MRSAHPLAVPDFGEDPYRVLRRLRESEPICLVEEGAEPGVSVLVSSHEHATAVLRDERFSSNLLLSPAVRRSSDHLPEDLRPEQQNPSMLTVDPPHHTRLRGLVNRAFTPKRVAELEGRIAQIANELLDALPDSGRCELLESFAGPLPARVIAELLGVPPGDHERFRAWSDTLVRSFVGSRAGEVRAFRRARDDLRRFLGDVIAARRETPRDDMISGLIEASEEEDLLTEDEIVGTCELLLVAGHETTTNLIANGFALIAARPEAQARLRARPEGIEAAIEEVLRFDSPLQGIGRIAREDVELAGVRIPKGASVSVLIGAVNRDPEVFTEPETFDAGREDNPHLAFGNGVHFCLGAALARLEARVAFEGLLQRHPRWELEQTRLDYRPSFAVRGLESLPVRLG